MNVPWSEDKVSLFELMNRYTVGDELKFLIYRKGTPMQFDFKLKHKYLQPIRNVYAEFEKPTQPDGEQRIGPVSMQNFKDAVNLERLRANRISTPPSRGKEGDSDPDVTKLTQLVSTINLAREVDLPTVEEDDVGMEESKSPLSNSLPNPGGNGGGAQGGVGMPQAVLPVVTPPANSTMSTSSSSGSEG